MAERFHRVNILSFSKPTVLGVDSVGRHHDRSKSNDADDIARFGRSLDTAARRLMHRNTAGELALRCGLSLPAPSWFLLDRLSEGGAMRAADIASMLAIDASSLTPRLKSLEGLGLIERAPSPNDARVSLIGVSHLGKEAVRRLHTAQTDLVSEIMSGLQIDANILSAMTNLLDHISAQLEKVGGRNGRAS